VAAILSPENKPFAEDFREFAARVAFHGALNSLSQMLIKIGSPCVVDFYQGSELWDLRLVDPDNRQPVDFDLRTRALSEFAPGVPNPDLISLWQSGKIKLFVAQRALGFRREQADLFLRGKYLPVAVKGPKHDSVFAFARHFRRSWALVVVPRLTTRLTSPPVMPLGESPWADTAIVLPENSPEHWTDMLGARENIATGRNKSNEIPVAALLRDLPVAMLSARK
jgi:(1->4)-alpha-D-glucan 1-alpha-D-glucosylmutase